MASELASWAVGGGIITMALFPFALPLILLTALAALPLIPLLLAGLLLAPPYLALRALVRRVRAARERPPEPAQRERSAPSGRVTVRETIAKVS